MPDFIESTLVVPASGHGLEKAADPDAARAHTEPHLQKALERLRAEGLRVEGIVGDGDPLAADVGELPRLGQRRPVHSQ